MIEFFKEFHELGRFVKSLNATVLVLVPKKGGVEDLKEPNTNNMLQVRRPYKSLSPHWCILCKGSGESIDHFFLHCSVTLGLWHRPFNVVNLDWVPARSIGDIMIISFRGLENSIGSKTLGHITCITILWVVWQERNVRIF